MEYSEVSSNGSFLTLNGSGNLSFPSTTATPGTILFTYVLPVIIFVGLWGNIMSFIVFLDKELRNISSSVYILAVLCSDTGMLLNQMITWLEPLGFNPWFGEGTCQLFVFSGFVFAFLSEWYVVCITVENYVTLRHPTQIKTLCTVPRALIVTISLALLSISSYCIFLFSTKTTNGKCQDTDMNEKTKQIYFYIDNITTLLLPTIVLFVLLAGIIMQVIKSIKSKRRMSLSKNQKKKSSIPQVRVAKMLFVLSISSFFLSTPDHILKLYFFMSGMNFTVMTEAQKVTSLVLMFLYYTRFSIKFFILIAFSKNFRKKIVTKIRCCKNKYDMVQNHEQTVLVDVGTNAPPST